MKRSTPDRRSRDEILEAVTDSGRRLSTAVVLFHSNVSRRVGLGSTEEKVLELVHRHRQATVGELADLAGMPKNSLSDLLDRLEDKGFVERRRHPDDGRKVAVIGTEAGAARIGAQFGGLMASLAALNEEFSTEELAIVAEYLGRAAEIQTAESRALSDGAASSNG